MTNRLSGCGSTSSTTVSAVWVSAVWMISRPRRWPRCTGCKAPASGAALLPGPEPALHHCLNRPPTYIVGGLPNAALVAPEYDAHGIPIAPWSDAVASFAEACTLIRRMWTEEIGRDPGWSCARFSCPSPTRIPRRRGRPWDGSLARASRTSSQPAGPLPERRRAVGRRRADHPDARPSGSRPLVPIVPGRVSWASLTENGEVTVRDSHWPAPRRLSEQACGDTCSRKSTPIS
jgi:hypothetical protein